MSATFEESKWASQLSGQERQVYDVVRNGTRNAEGIPFRDEILRPIVNRLLKICDETWDAAAKSTNDEWLNRIHKMTGCKSTKRIESR